MEAGSGGVSASAQACEASKEIGDIVNSIPVYELAGIEVSPGPASVPGEFAGVRTGRGMVLLRTRVSDRDRPRER